MLYKRKREPMGDESDRVMKRSDSINIDAEGEIKKKRYEKPQIVYRAPLEAMAAVCAPSPPSKSNPGVCPQGPISS